MGDISPHSFTLGQAFHHLLKPPFSWFERVIACAPAIAHASCQNLFMQKSEIMQKWEKFLVLIFHKTWKTSFWAHWITFWAKKWEIFRQKILKNLIYKQFLGKTWVKLRKNRQTDKLRRVFHTTFNLRVPKAI